MADMYKLPASSYEELIKIIKAYGNVKSNISVSLDDLVKSSGMNRTVLSKNNGFLMQVGLITKGNKKSPTEVCQKLAQAYNMNLTEKIESLWRSIFEQDEFISNMITVVNVKSRITRSEYINHILYSANCGNTNTYKAGAAAIIDILKLIHIIEESDGFVVLCDVEYSNNLQENSREVEHDNYYKNNNLVSAIGCIKEPIVLPESNYYIQQYTCESGQIAKIIIPENASEDDLLGFRDMLDIALKRKFKINVQ